MNLQLSKRIIWLDSLKGFLMLLVIFGHCTKAGADNYFIAHVNNALSSIAMPGFMACSGWLAQSGGGRFIRRFKQLIIPYFLWSVLYYFTEAKYNDKSIYDIFFKPDSFMWFLWALFWIFCVFEVCKWISSKFRINGTLIILFMALLLMAIMVILDLRVLGIQFISYYFLFYSLGYFYRSFKQIQINSIFAIVTFFTLWAFLAYFWSMHGLPYWIPSNTMIPSSILQYLYRGFTSVVGVILLFALFSKFLNKEGLLVNRLYVHCGKISLGLYVVHITIKDKIYEVISTMIPNLNIYMFVLLDFFIVLTFSYIIVIVLGKFEFTNQYLLGKF